MLSSGPAKHTGTFTLQLPLSVSPGVSSLLCSTSGDSNLLVSHDHTEAEGVPFYFDRSII